MKKDFSKILNTKILFGVFFTLFAFTQVHAQKKITGTITDDQDIPVTGASVTIEGKTTGTVSDFDGNFIIQANPEDVLNISYIGFKDQKVAIGNSKQLNIKLETSLEQLDDVILIGYGTAKKSDLTGSVARVTAKSFENQPVTRVEEALQGRAAGVTVAKANGAPGSSIKVRIRGANSITGSNDPLVVIDGIQGGDLSTLNPNDIASMDILKDASATAVYGVRGSNGVILISTKKGKGRGKINVDYFTTISQVPSLLPTLATNPAEFARLENIRRVNTGGNPIFTDAEISDLRSNGGTNYQDELFRTGISNNIQLSASGSEGKLRYFLSGNYRDEEGIVINTGYKQISARSNLSAQINDKLNIGFNMYASRSTTKNDFQAFGNGQGSLVFKALTWDPTTPIFDTNGNYNLRSSKGIASLNQNPIFTARESLFDKVNDQLNTAVNLSYKISDNFTYALNAGTQLRNINDQQYKVEGSNDISDTFFNTDKNTSYQISNILTWQKEFNEHDIKVTGVHEYINSEQIINNYTANDLLLPNGFYFAELAPESSQTVKNSLAPRELLSFMLRGEYNWNDQLYLTGTLRRDQSTVFRSDKNVGYFPSIAASYNFNDFIDNASFINNIKLRAGWGQVGNQNINPFATFGTLKINTSYSFDGSSAVPGATINTFPSPATSWEITNQFNFGADFSFQKNRGNLSIDVFNKKTTDVLLDNPVSPSNGGQTFINNIGEVENKGIDISLGYDIINTPDFNWKSNLSVSYVQNEVTKLFDGATSIQGKFLAPGGQARRLNAIELDQPLGQFIGATFLGTWKSSEATQAAAFGLAPGDAKYLRDDDGNIIIGAIGNGTPDLFWGFNNTFTYKNWDMNVFLQGVHGFDVYNIQQAAITGGAGDSRSFLATEQSNQWTPTNETNIPSKVQLFNSSRYVEKGDFIRLSNLTIGYKIKKPFGKNTSLKIYGGGQNLFLITKYTGYDPELSSSRATNNPDTDQGTADVTSGINIGAYPNPRTYTLGVKIGF